MNNTSPRMDLPDELLHSENGVGVFFNPDEGHEIIRNFDKLTSGFKKEGVNLTADEYDAIRDFITADCISPNFVKTMVNRYGEKSINAAYLINPEMKIVDYLLHKHKGHYFRNRYPLMTLIE